MKTRTVDFTPDDRRVEPLRAETNNLESPLTADETIKPPILIRLIPLGIAVVVIVMIVLMFTMGKRAFSPMMFMFPMMMIMGMMGMTMHGGGVGGNTMAEVDINRRNWLIQLRELRKSVQDQGRRIHNLMYTSFPNPLTLTSATSYEKMWQVRKSKAYTEALAQSTLTEHPFMSARAGVGMIPLEPNLQYEPQQVPENLEPVTAGQFSRFLGTQQVITNCPIGIRLDEERSYGLRGHVPSRYDLARSMLISLAFNHSPNELLLGIITDPTDPEALARWDWMKWLPHNQDSANSPADMPPLRLSWASLDDFAVDMAADLAARGSQNTDYAGPRLLVFVDLPEDTLQWPKSMYGGVPTVGFVAVNYKDDLLNAYTPGRVNLILVKEDGVLSLPSRQDMLTIDRVSVRQAENFARQMSRFRPPGFGSGSGNVLTLNDDSDVSLPTWFDAIGIPDLESFDPRLTWSANSHTESLRVPIGYKFDGKNRIPELMNLDFVEASRGGSGPHGVVQGKTGSGKSYLLNGIVLTMCAMYGPDKICFILADFKAGTAFEGFDKLPHVIATLTNLQDRKDMVDRAGDVLDGELMRRQELMAQYGVKDILDYRKLQRNDPTIPALPDLFLVADEFHEFMRDNRSYLRLFSRIGALGRAFGMHVIPCSQFIDEALLGDLMQHITFGISLTAANAQYSRVVLKDASAASLPMGSGQAMIRYVDKETGDDRLETFVGFPVEDPYVSRVRTDEQRVSARRDLEDSALPFELFASPEEKTNSAHIYHAEDYVTETVHDIQQKLALIDHLSRFDEVRAPQLWQPALNIPMSLADVNPEIYRRIREMPGVNLLLGDTDDPFRHSRPPFVVSPKGNIGIYGGYQSGKSMVVKAMVATSALIYQDEVSWYLIDQSGGLESLENFPNVGGYATKRDEDLIDRLIGEFYNVLAYRESTMAENRISQFSDYLANKKNAPDSRDPYGHMFLVIEDFEGLRQDDEGKMKWDSVLNRLLTAGGRYGLHVVITAQDPNGLSYKMQAMFEERIMLYVDDISKMGSMRLDVRERAKTIPSNQPGRGLNLKTGLKSLILVPQLEAISPRNAGHTHQEAEYNYYTDYSSGIKAFGKYLAERISPVPRILDAPSVIPYHLLWETIQYTPGLVDPQLPKKDRWLPLGIDTSTLFPVCVPKGSPHLLIAGDRGSGKTTVLRTLITSVVNQYQPDEAKFIIFDSEFGLVDEMENLTSLGYMSPENYANSRNDIAGPLEVLEKVLKNRIPTREIMNPRALQQRDWFSGPEIFVLIDRFNGFGSVGGSSSDLEAKLVPYLTQFADLGVHLYVTSSAAGINSSLMMNKLFKVFNEQSTPLLLLSGPATEGSISPLKAKFKNRRPGLGQLLLPSDMTSLTVQTAYVDPWSSETDT